MKRVLAILSVIIMVCASAIPTAFAAPAITLTVNSSNPESGVPITVSPLDKDGSGNGTTKFIRSYSRRSVVTLSAPATANGNNFQKWLKNGAHMSDTVRTLVKKHKTS